MTSPHKHRRQTTIRHVIYGLAAICWGAVPVCFYAADRIHKYLATEFRTVALVGGLGMIVLGLFSILTAREDADCGHDHDHDCDHDHDHGADCGHGGHDHHHHEHSDPNPLVTLLLMILPVGAAVAWTTDEFSDRALMRKSIDNKKGADAFFADLPPFTRETLDKTTPKTPDGHYQLDLTQLFWSAGDEEVMEVFDGLPVEIEGRVMEERAELNPDGRRLRLFRVFMTCCAADAQVLGVAMEFDSAAPDIPGRSWVRVRGMASYEDVEGRTDAVLQVSSIEPAEEPYEEFMMEGR